MAIDKKTLQRFLDNPAMFKPEDMGLDEPESEQETEAEKVIGEEPEEILEAPESQIDGAELAEADEDGLGELLTTLRDDLNTKHDVGAKAFIGGEELPETSPDLEKLKRLRAGQPIEDEGDEQESADVASDMKAPIELRKKALQRIKQKYLGQ